MAGAKRLDTRLQHTRIYTAASYNIFCKSCELLKPHQFFHYDLNWLVL